MRTTGGALGVLVSRGAFTLLVLTGVLFVVLPAGAAGIPQPVSPGARSAGALVEARCPTFSWAGVEGAAGYELAVFRVAAAPEAEPVLVTRTSLPERVQTWTPALGQCLERGERYAWSVATTRGRSDAEGALAWAPVLLFEVDRAPSSDELEQAIATIQRHLATRGDRAALRELGAPAREAEPSAIADPGTRRAAARAGERPLDGAARAPSFLRGPLSSSTTSGQRTASAASTPPFGSASLTVTNQIHLGAASDVFKDGSVFLWDDSSGNSALGRNALSSVSGDATNNTALGREALENTTGGGTPLKGSYNTAVGDRALRANTYGYSNTASGSSALSSNTTGFYNTASGADALYSNQTGSRNTASGYYALRGNINGSGNTALGHFAGVNTTGSHNILINNTGASAESNVLRIGAGTGTGSSELDKAFIQGIFGRIVANDTATGVLIDSDGQLGTISSSRALKQDVQDLGPLAGRLLELRPVAFRFKQHVASDPATPLQFGLIAEEVAEVFPELVVYDEAGKPQTVKYHLLSSLLLGELQKQHRELEGLRTRLAALESRSRACQAQPSGGDLGRGSR